MTTTPNPAVDIEGAMGRLEELEGERLQIDAQLAAIERDDSRFRDRSEQLQQQLEELEDQRLSLEEQRANLDAKVEAIEQERYSLVDARDRIDQEFTDLYTVLDQIAEDASEMGADGPWDEGTPARVVTINTCPAYVGQDQSFDPPPLPPAPPRPSGVERTVVGPPPSGPVAPMRLSGPVAAVHPSGPVAAVHPSGPVAAVHPSGPVAPMHPPPSSPTRAPHSQPYPALSPASSSTSSPAPAPWFRRRSTQLGSLAAVLVVGVITLAAWSSDDTPPASAEAATAPAATEIQATVDETPTLLSRSDPALDEPERSSASQPEPEKKNRNARKRRRNGKRGGKQASRNGKKSNATSTKTKARRGKTNRPAEGKTKTPS